MFSPLLVGIGAWPGACVLLVGAFGRRNHGMQQDSVSPCCARRGCVQGRRARLAGLAAAGAAGAGGLHRFTQVRNWLGCRGAESLPVWWHW